MKRFCYTLLFFGCVCLVNISVIYAQTEIPSDKSGFVNWLKEKFGSDTEVTEVVPQKITVRGKVLDQFEDPVIGAEVEVGTTVASAFDIFNPKIEKKTYVTDNSGEFNFEVMLEVEPSIDKITRKGYEFQWSMNPYFDLDPTQQLALFQNSQQNPLIFYLRKLGTTTFLLKSQVGYYFKEPLTTLSYTIIPGLLRPIKPDFSNLRNPLQRDLVFSVERNVDGGYAIHIRPIPDNGGAMQILDNYLYEAPLKGYQSEVSLTVRPGDGEQTKYLYFISRKKPVYSRMTMHLKVRTMDGELHLVCSTWTNPYGNSNLEWEPELPNKLRHILRKEAENALNNGTLPPEPEDLQALIEQYSD